MEHAFLYSFLKVSLTWMHQSDTNVIPTLTLITKHKKPVFVHRGETKQPIETNQQMELQSGDVLSLVQSITFRWASSGNDFVFLAST